MNVWILISIQILLILVAILINIIWIIFPKLNSALFYTLIGIDIVVILGLFIWYIVIFKSNLTSRKVVISPTENLVSGTSKIISDNNSDVSTAATARLSKDSTEIGSSRSSSDNISDVPTAATIPRSRTPTIPPLLLPDSTKIGSLLSSRRGSTASTEIVLPGRESDTLTSISRCSKTKTSSPGSVITTVTITKDENRKMDIIFGF